MRWVIFRAVVDAVLEFRLLGHRTRCSLVFEVGARHRLRVSDATGFVYRVFCESTNPCTTQVLPKVVVVPSSIYWYRVSTQIEVLVDCTDRAECKLVER